jgi:hypothetical protein
MQNNLPDFMGDYSHPVSVENGGHRDKFTIEMWIVPKGASLPIPRRSTGQPDPAAPLPYMFDEAEASIMDYKNKSSLQFGLACTLSFPDWAEFHRVVRDKPEQRGHIIIYVGYDDPVGQAHRIERFLRAFLKKYYGKGFKELTMAYGGKREWSQIEIWLVPKEHSDPVPTPGTRRARAR